MWWITLLRIYIIGTIVVASFSALSFFYYCKYPDTVPDNVDLDQIPFYEYLVTIFLWPIIILEFIVLFIISIIFASTKGDKLL